MKIIYAVNIRMPSERAHSIQIVKMCEALADQGEEVELVVPTRRTQITNDPYEYYGIKNNFKITKLPVLDLVRFGRIGYWIEVISFCASLLLYLRKSVCDYIYGRDEAVMYAASYSKRPMIWEVHYARTNIFIRRMLKRANLIVAITQSLKNYYGPLTARPILVAHDGVDLRSFTGPATHEGKVVTYTGGLGANKGVDTLREAAKRLPSDVKVQIISGRPYNEIPGILSASDVLVLPNSGKDLSSSTYTSPMKLFEYMASGVPIVASDVPAIREVLDESTAVLVKPNDPVALADGIVKVLNNPQLAMQLTSAAKERVKSYSWSSRAKGILDFIRG